MCRSIRQLGSYYYDLAGCILTVVCPGRWSGCTSSPPAGGWWRRWPSPGCAGGRPAPRRRSPGAGGSARWARLHIYNHIYTISTGEAPAPAVHRPAPRLQEEEVITPSVVLLQQLQQAPGRRLLSLTPGGSCWEHSQLLVQNKSAGPFVTSVPILCTGDPQI